MTVKNHAVSFEARVIFEYKYACRPFFLENATDLNTPQKLFDAVKAAYPPAAASTLYGKRYVAPLLILQETSERSASRTSRDVQPLSTKRFMICEMQQTIKFDWWHQRTVQNARDQDGGTTITVELHLRTLEAALRAKKEDWLNEALLGHPEFVVCPEYEELNRKTYDLTEESEPMQSLQGDWPSPPWDLQMQDGGRAIRAENVVDFEVTDVAKLPGTWPWFPPRKYEEEWAKDMNQVRLGPR